ncbi:MAG: UvrD-helicase domain-containing protein [Coriobacteriia bacterium]|nr:UvrD-helicase domain-containing protein [Coriobacteriia bacterium]
MAELDPRQFEAVTAGPVDLFVEAGAGSGKTRVLAARFVSAVLGEEPYEACVPGELLAVTFTEKAAGELSERIRGELMAAGAAASARAVGDAWISTIHGMCARMLRQHAFAAGIDPHFRVLDEVEASVLEASAMEDAARAAMSCDGASAALFDEYGYDAVVTAARFTRASVRSLGVSIEDVAVIDAKEVVDRLHQVANELSAVAGGFEGLRSLKTVDDDAALVRAAVQTLASASGRGEPDAERLLAELPTGGFKHLSSVEGLDELVDSAIALVEEARACAAQLLVDQHERAFLSFVSAFDEGYSRAKARRGMLDFEDLQLETARLLELHPEVAAEYRSRFKMLMLDEFQDTNALQMRVIDSLSDSNLCTVGDENQSIYAFRHADVEVFRERARRVTETRQLDINYRSAPDLLEAVNGLFSHGALLGAGFMSLLPPKQGKNRPDWPADQPRFEARFIDWSGAKGIDTHEAEAECIAGRVSELIDSGVEPRDIAILMRALAGGRARKVERALTARNIRVHLASGGAYFDCPEVMEACALLRVIDNVRDDVALTVVLAGRLTGLSPESMISIRRCADRLGTEKGLRRSESRLWDALTDPEVQSRGDEAAALRCTIDAITDARRLRGLRSLSQTVLQPLLALDFDLVLFASGPGGARSWGNVLKLARMADEYETATGGDLGGFLEYLELRDAHSTSEQEATLDGESDAVRIMSIHAAKGLEFPVVIVGGLSGGGDVSSISMARVDGRPMLGMVLHRRGGSIPTLSSMRVKSVRRAVDDAEAIRLLYVACTRAQEGLTVIARTNPLKDADDSLGGLIRRALGMGAAGTLVDCDGVRGQKEARVRLVPAATSEEEEVPEGGESEEPAARSGREALPSSPVSRLPADEDAMATGRRMVPRRVSYTGLATYSRCPYRFYLTSIAKLPAPPAAQGGEALAFGSALHAVLERLDSPSADVKGLIEMAMRSAGLRKSAGPRLKSAVDAYLALPVAEDIFGCQRVMREAPIAIPVAGTVLAGAIDVLAWNDDRALIVDYKTGSTLLTDERAIERYRLQGECYSLAAFAAGASAVRVVFAEVERGRESSYSYGEKDSGRIRGHVSSIIESMSTEGFPAKSEYERDFCETCPGLNGMCPVTRPSAGGAA